MSTTHNTGTIPSTYPELMKQHMLRPIHDKVGFDNAMGMVKALAGRNLNQDQEDYLEALSTLMEAYEAELLAEDRAKLPRGHEMLVYLCKENEITGAELGRILNVTRAQGANLLKNERKITAEHTLKLGQHFKVDPGLFLA